MAAGSIKLQSNDTRIATVTFEDGAAGNVSVVVPKEGGVLASEDYAVAKSGDETIAGIKTFTSPPVVDGRPVSTGQRKNYLINGNLDMWQRGTSQTTSGYSSVDRWQTFVVGSTFTVTRTTSGYTATEIGSMANAMFSYKVVVNSVVGASNQAALIQPIENISILAGKTATLSFWMKADAPKWIYVFSSQFFGTGGSPSSAVNSNQTAIQLTTTWTKYSIVMTIPSIEGKTIGTDGLHTTYTGIRFQFEANTNLTTLVAAAFGQQSGTFDIAQVKLEDGAVATDGWHPYDGEFGGEVQACQRYYETGADSWGGTCSRFVGNVSSGIPYDSTTKFKVTKRTTPTVVLSNIYVSGFQSTVGAVNASIGGFAESRVASSSLSVGTFISGFTASAEL